MITKFELFEFYTGPYKAAGFKHYQEIGFGFIIYTTKKGLKDFKSIQKTFLTYMKKLGSESDLTITDENNSIVLSFNAVNKIEAFSIIEQINKYFKNKKITIKTALMIPNITDDNTLEYQMKNTIDVTNYMKRPSKLMNNAYKSSKIGF